jgi:hypothetical protein
MHGVKTCNWLASLLGLILDLQVTHSPSAPNNSYMCFFNKPSNAFSTIVYTFHNYVPNIAQIWWWFGCRPKFVTFQLLNILNMTFYWINTSRTEIIVFGLFPVTTEILNKQTQQKTLGLQTSPLRAPLVRILLIPVVCLLCFLEKYSAFHGSKNLPYFGPFMKPCR